MSERVGTECDLEGSRRCTSAATGRPADVRAERWPVAPLDDSERALGDIAEWGPTEDWSAWDVDVAGAGSNRGDA